MAAPASLGDGGGVGKWLRGVWMRRVAAFGGGGAGRGLWSASMNSGARLWYTKKDETVSIICAMTLILDLEKQKSRGGLPSLNSTTDGGDRGLLRRAKSRTGVGVWLAKVGDLVEGREGHAGVVFIGGGGVQVRVTGGKIWQVWILRRGLGGGLIAPLNGIGLG